MNGNCRYKCVILSNPGADYRNFRYLTPADITMGDRHYADYADKLSDIDMLYAKARLEARSRLLNAIDRAARYSIHNDAAWYSDSARSPIASFNPSVVEIPDNVPGDYFELVNTLSILQHALDEVYLIKQCPLDSVQKVLEDIESAKDDARKEARK